MGQLLPEPFSPATLIARIDARAAESADALQVIARPDQHSDAVIVTACETVMRTPGDWLAFERARLLLAAIRRDQRVAA